MYIYFYLLDRRCSGGYRRDCIYASNYREAYIMVSRLINRMKTRQVQLVSDGGVAREFISFDELEARYRRDPDGTLNS